LIGREERLKLQLDRTAHGIVMFGGHGSKMMRRIASASPIPSHPVCGHNCALAMNWRA